MRVRLCICAFIIVAETECVVSIRVRTCDLTEFFYWPFPFVVRGDLL